MTFEEVWETSRHNQYSSLLPVVLCLGFVILLLLSKVRMKPRRILLKMIAFPVLLCVAMCDSSMEITEKWRIRQEWTRQHWDSLTQEQLNISMGDGANLVLGPMIFGGGYGFLIFSCALLLSSLFGWSQETEDQIDE